MDRRDFLGKGLVLASAALGGQYLDLGSALAAPRRVFADSFKRVTTSNWGKGWYNQRYGLQWSVHQSAAVYELPAPYTYPATSSGAGDFNPNPVTVLDSDVADVDLSSVVSSDNAHARFGLVARMAGYSEFYAAYYDGTHLRISRFAPNREVDLPVGRQTAKAFTVKAGARYRIRFRITGTAPVKLQAKIWKAADREPKHWMLSVADADQQRIKGSGSFGYVVMHDGVTRRPSKIQVSNFKADSPDAGRPSPPRLTFAFAGRIDASAEGLRARVVAKTDIPSDIKFHVGTDPKLAKFRVVHADETFDKFGIAKGWLKGPEMQPGATVYWRAQAQTDTGGRERGRIHALKLPANGNNGADFAFGSCTHLYPVSRSFKTATSMNPLFFTHLGDLGYAQDSEGAAMAERPDAYQDRWARMLGRPTMARLHEKAAWLMLQDDHDYGGNNVVAKNLQPFTIDAWNEMSGNLDERHFEARYGDLHAFFVDLHRWADGVGKENPSLLGADQKQWLKSAMSDSDANLLVLFSSMPLWGAGRGDITWKGTYSAEREDLLDFLLKLQGPNRRVIVCSGNAHAQYVNRFAGRSGEKDLYEFVSSGTDRVDSTATGRPMAIPDGDDVIDRQRAVKGVDAFGFVSLDPPGPGRRVTLRSIHSKSGSDVWAPLHIDL
jgi:hypothetical protein